jgi:hypothetical protein
MSYSLHWSRLRRVVCWGQCYKSPKLTFLRFGSSTKSRSDIQHFFLRQNGTRRENVARVIGDEPSQARNETATCGFCCNCFEWHFVHGLSRHLWPLQKSMASPGINGLSRRLWPLQTPMASPDVYGLSRRLWPLQTSMTSPDVYGLYRRLWPLQTYMASPDVYGITRRLHMACSIKRFFTWVNLVMFVPI